MMHVYRKFLYRNPRRADLVTWNIDTTPWADGKEIIMDISFSNGNGRNYVMTVDNNNKNVSASLEPLNELIASLSKAAMEFAKACNVPTVKIEEKKETKPKKAAKKEPKSETSKK